MKKKFRSLILLAAFAVLLVSMLAGCGKNEDETISIELEDVVQAKDGVEIILEIENDAGNKISLGWAGGCQIEVTTKENEYYYEPFMTEIPQGKSTLTVPLKDSEADVKIEKIVITRLCLLNDRGLPGRELKDVVVYDKAADIEEFEGAFGFFGSEESIFIIMMIAVPSIMVIAIVVAVIFIVSAHKKNKKAMEQFNPYGAAAPNMDFQQMHNDAHQRFMQQQQMQQHMDFAQKSGTTMDQGGFVPPPPPPPPTGM